MCDSPLNIRVGDKEIGLSEYQVPCGKCPPCKMRRINDWVFRLVQEGKVSESAHFVTLTYERGKCPRTKNNFKTLDKKQLQSFWKRLRENNENKLKYFAVGEYGDETKRPHYHAIIFNMDEPDIPDKFNLLNRQVAIQNKLQKIWKKGFVHVGTVTQDSMAYCIKYIDKEKTIGIHERDDREKEFAVMSRNLGLCYIQNADGTERKENVEYIKNNIGSFITLENGYNYNLPRYYRKRLFTEQENREFRKKMSERHKELTEKEQQRLIKNKIKNSSPEWEMDKKRYYRHKIFYKRQKKRNGIKDT